MASGPITSWVLAGEKVKAGTDFIFLDSKIMQMVIAAMKLKDIAPWKKSYDKPRQCIKKQKHHFADEGLYSCWSFNEPEPGGPELAMRKSKKERG